MTLEPSAHISHALYICTLKHEQILRFLTTTRIFIESELNGFVIIIMQLCIYIAHLLECSLPSQPVINCNYVCWWLVWIRFIWTRIKNMILTSTAQPLPSHPRQNIETEVAVGRLKYGDNNRQLVCTHMGYL